MARGALSNEIGIVLYPGVQLAAVHGLTDLFFIASRIAAESRKNGSGLRVTHWSLANGDLSCVYRTDPSATSRPDTLILPPTLVDLPDPDTCSAIEHWLFGQHAQGVGLVTICSGVFLVAGTGLLDGRMVSTHRSCAQALIDSFPNIAVNADERMIEHPGILTAGGFMAWVDVGLMLIGRLLGDAVCAETARFVLSDQAAKDAQRVTGFVPPQSHSDLAVRRAQEFVHIRDGQGITLASMAAAARLERRTFLRRFINATGMTPIEYCRAVRIARARELLEAGNMPLKKIAETLGYMDMSSFARAFRRANGVPPGAYRRQHGDRGRLLGA
jgi:transcriptional regulator GlxA family with amidase domain